MNEFTEIFIGSEFGSVSLKESVKEMVFGFYYMALLFTEWGEIQSGIKKKKTQQCREGYCGWKVSKGGLSIMWRILTVLLKSS